MSSAHTLRTALAHVLWIGGAPDAGKTSIANLLAAKHQLQVYHFDHATAAEHPALYAAHPVRMTPDERWVQHTVERMVRETIASWTERCGMAIEDLLVMPKRPMIVAEGPGFFPECIAPLIRDAHQAIWLQPTEPFKQASATRRNKLTTRDKTSDPAHAQRNLVMRATSDSSSMSPGRRMRAG